MRRRYTDKMLEFDMRQMLLLEEGTLRLRPEARSHRRARAGGV